MTARLVGGAFGLLFGFMISWGHFTDPDEIREMLLLEDLYLWKMFATAVAVAFVGSRLVRGRRAWFVRERVSWTTSRPGSRHFAGAATFGLGWAIAASCPAPIAAQLAQGVWWSAFTLVGVGAGVLLYQRREAARPDARADAGPDTPAEPVAPALAASRYVGAAPERRRRSGTGDAAAPAYGCIRILIAPSDFFWKTS
jgi:uncharacterized membrane protein YedE/YeeE